MTYGPGFRSALACARTSGKFGKSGGFRGAPAHTIGSLAAISVVLLCVSQLARVRDLPRRDPSQQYANPSAPFANHLLRDWRHGMAKVAFGPVSAAPRDIGNPGSEIGGWDGVRQGVGVYFVAYGRDCQRFVRDAHNSARMIRRLNPGIRTAIATNYRGPLLEAFNHTVHVPSRHFDSSRQWLTRLYYLALSPFELTLEIDSTVRVCSTALLTGLEGELLAKRFDFATQVEYVSLSRRRNHVVHTHNFVLLYFWNANTALLLSEWLKIYKDNYATLDDQKALTLAMRSPKVLKEVRVAKIRDNFALGFLSPAVCSTSGSRSRCTRAFSGNVSMFHSYDGKRVPSKYKQKICDFLNSKAERRQVLFKLSEKSRYRLFTSERDCKASGFGSICTFLVDSGSNTEGAVEELPESDAWIRAIRE